MDLDKEKDLSDLSSSSNEENSDDEENEKEILHEDDGTVDRMEVQVRYSINNCL
jgi:hypothetical protein